MTEKKFEAPPPSRHSGALGYAPMDKIHEEFDELLVNAQRCQPSDWVAVLTEIHAHLTEHFEAENKWMRESDFPSRDCHIDEHAAVLESSAKIVEMARAGAIDRAPAFIEALVEWFPGHATHLDSALSAWLCKQQFGGKPVVMHRRAIS